MKPKFKIGDKVIINPDYYMANKSLFHKRLWLRELTITRIHKKDNPYYFYTLDAGDDEILTGDRDERVLVGVDEVPAMYKLKLNDGMIEDRGTEILRVPGGWIYSFPGNGSVFVPFNNEFLP